MLKISEITAKIGTDIAHENNYVKYIIAGYTSEEIKLYHKALQERSEMLLDSIPCRCFDLFVCPVCSIRRLREKMDRKYKGTQYDYKRKNKRGKRK